MATKKLPVFDAVLDGPETGVNEIAFVSDPAILIKGVAFASQTPKQRIAAPILVPMNVYRNSEEDGEYEVRFTSQEIEAIVQDFQQKSKTAAFNLEHQTGVTAPAYLLESWLVGENTKADRSYSEFGVDVPAGTWFGVSQITDTKFYNQLVANEQTGYSIEGLLGLTIKQNKQIKQNKMKKFKLSNVQTVDGSTLFVDGDIAIGTNVFLIQPDGTKVVPEDGELELEDGSTIEIEGGAIAEVSAAGEEGADAADGETEEMAADAPVSGDTKDAPVVKTPDVAPKDSVPTDVPAITAEEVSKMIDDKVGELVSKLAELQTSIDSLQNPSKDGGDTPITDKTKMSNQKFSVSARIAEFIGA